MAAAALALGLVHSAWAQSINYTVQVVALSDRDGALSVQNDLLRQGFPAYVVRSTSAQGDIFRVRVGAFANRPAALHYANAMPEVSGGRAVPALAEAIPAGITPLAPRLLFEQDVSGNELRLLAFPEGGLALRLQWRVPLGQAEYVIYRGGTVERVKAWQLVDGPDGQRLRVRDMALWADTWQQDPQEVRDAYEANVLALVAERLGVGAAKVAAARYVPPGDEVPRLIVVEKLTPRLSDVPELLGVGLPASGMTAAGPIAYLGIDPGLLPGVPESARLDLATRSVTGTLARATWSGFEDGAEAPENQGSAGQEGETEGPGTPPEAPTEPEGEPEAAGSGAGPEDAGPGGGPEDAGPGGGPEDATPAPASPAPGAASSAPGVVIGDDWQAVADGAFVRLTAVGQDGAALTSWRACVGLPIWSDGHYLLALQDGALLVYDFLPR